MSVFIFTDLTFTFFRLNFVRFFIFHLFCIHGPHSTFYTHYSSIYRRINMIIFMSFSSLMLTSLLMYKHSSQPPFLTNACHMFRPQIENWLLSFMCQVVVSSIHSDK